MTPADKLPVTSPANWIPDPQQGDWSYDDYAALPDDGNRYEIVEGVLYMSPAPSILHLKIVGRIFYYLFTYVELEEWGTVLTSPVDVVLSRPNIFQPDVLVILNAGQEKLQEARIVGAPDLAVEVASPGSSISGRNRKYRVYARTEVKEYWIVDPGTRSIEVLVLEDDDYCSLGVFREKATLPSRIVPELPVQVKQFFPTARPTFKNQN
jgi:Uma2 family endonuclease